MEIGTRAVEETAWFRW